MIDIIIPIYLFDRKITELTKITLESIKNSTRTEHQIILVDNGSNSDFMEEVEIYSKDKKINIQKIIQLETNFGYTEAINQGICNVTNEYVVLGNNDIVATLSWDIKAIRIFERDLTIGVVSPMTDTESYQSKGLILRQYGLNRQFAILNRPISFFFAMFKKKVLDEVGLLNQELEDGLGTDDDYFVRMREKGYKTAVDCKTVFHHEHRASFLKVYPDFNTRKQNAIQYLRERGKLLV